MLKKKLSIQVPKLMNNNFKIANFCSTKYLTEFKNYYNYLNNPIYVSYFMHYLAIANSPQMKTKILEMIKKNKKQINESLKKAVIVIEYYEQNNLITKS